MSQAHDEVRAGSAWADQFGLVFTQPHGARIDPGRDYRAWQCLLKKCGLPPMRLHDDRHTAATLLLSTVVPTRAAME